MNIWKIKRLSSLQRDEADCGVACLASLLRYYGGMATFDRIRELCGTQATGTTLLGLCEGARNLGFEADGCKTSIEVLKTYGKPVVLHLVLSNGLQHYVVCYGYKKGKFIIFDPAIGVIKYSQNDLEARWQSKVCLTLEPKNVITQKKNKKEKYHFLFSLFKEDIQILVFVALIGVVVGILEMTTAVFSQKLLDEVLPKDEFNILIVSVCLLAVLLLFRVLIVSFKSWLVARQSKAFNLRIMDNFFERILSLKLDFFETRKVGDIVARLNDIRRVQKVVSITIAGNVLIDGFVIVASLVMLCIYAWQLALILLFFIPIILLYIWKKNDKIIVSQQEVMSGYSSTESFFHQVFSGIRSIKVGGLSHQIVRKNRSIYEYFQNKTYSLDMLNLRMMAFYGIVTSLLLVVIILVGGWLVLRGVLSIGGLVAAIGIESAAIPALIQLSLLPIPINEAKVAFERLYDTIDRPTEELKNQSIDRIENISVRNISFGYQTAIPIIKDLSFDVKKGKFYCVVGNSGAGKTTLCKLMEKSYSVSSGNVVINGEIPLSDIDINNWREKIGVVLQETYIYDATLIENLGVTNEEEVSKVIMICNKYGLLDYLARFKQGWLTKIGESGVQLSGGEKQLIAFMRVLIKDPDLYILDEPTSSMDADLEMKVWSIISELSKEKLIVAVTHKKHILDHYRDSIIEINL